MAGLLGLAALCALLAAPAAAEENPKAKKSVIGGAFAATGSTVAVATERSLCSGSVIAPSRVLTAAHCTAEPNPIVIANRPFLGDHSVGQQISVIGVSIFPGWPQDTLHDLAILYLAEPTTAPPITLATPTEDSVFTAPRSTLTIAGYGQRTPTRTRRPQVGILTATEVTVRTSCQALYRHHFSAQTSICALGRPFPRLVVSRSACHGDSGGPLIANTSLGPRLVGVASYVGAVRKGKRKGIECGFWKLPDVYVRVTDPGSLFFIEQNIPPPPTPIGA